jgi:hypothetical protein
MFTHSGPRHETEVSGRWVGGWVGPRTSLGFLMKMECRFRCPYRDPVLHPLPISFAGSAVRANHDFASFYNCISTMFYLTLCFRKWGFESRKELGTFHHRVQTRSGAHPASYPLGTRGSFLGVKWSEREADHSSPYNAEVNECVELYLHSPNMSS